ncbi:beta-ketoacyl-[acyl-carrier-protein] synthase family protein [Micromonospora auratinigra]|uniref:3-oxoacyl-[acyl-carrier-protein] synthase II n=1 Tax=Micromonospora auratinigra TaxID=261654 RepID=A0A1A8ZD28_9ACTN|nr:beta-ketoacyl-[acyl-carrier-protein] synthase family protein [Micromonospora auratinigra]SBT41759.1 3-oxoacyl-[acyl-carrier-protein] synthase II [Micromonospora auratinigra]
MSGRVRVVVTGMGLKTPAGTSVKHFADVLAEGRSTAAPVPELVEAELPVTFACLVPDFDAEPYLSVRELRQYDRAAFLAVAAATDAVAEAQLLPLAAPERVGVAVGVGAGGLTPAERVVREYGDRPARVPAFTVPRTMANAAAARISLRLGARGSALTYVTACASGSTAIGEAMRKIRSGELDVVVAGGTEASVSPVVVSSFARMGAMSRRSGDPAAASRPFDAARDGFVMGEGAAFLVLERHEHARARGVPILGEVLGYGTNSDAYHVVAPRPDGAAAAECIRRALADAGLAPADVGHVNAHGTSTVQNDQAETLALLACFGDRPPPVTASKGVIGHLVGAAGAVEAVAALVAAGSGTVPPVANFTGGDEVTGRLDVVAGRPRQIPPGPALSNSFGFGGHNVSLVVAPC